MAKCGSGAVMFANTRLETILLQPEDTKLVSTYYPELTLIDSKQCHRACKRYYGIVSDLTEHLW